MDDKTAISRIKQGDLSGLETLVRRYQVRAVQAAFLIAQERSLAEETVQNAFLKVVEKIDQFDEERPFTPWFFRIVVNDAVKGAQKQSKLLDLQEEPDEEAQTLARWMIDPQPSPEEQVENRESEDNLRRAIRQISPEQRAVVVMRYYLDMNEKEMSTRLERPVSTIKWWLRAARKHLAALLQPARATEEPLEEVYDGKRTYERNDAKAGGKRGAVRFD